MSAARAGGPTDVFTTVFPIIVTHYPGPMLHFYRDLLGAKVGYEFHDASARLAYVGLRIGDADLGIAIDPAVSALSHRFSLWAYTP